jgi:hypothetical protein
MRTKSMILFTVSVLQHGDLHCAQVEDRVYVATYSCDGSVQRADCTPDTPAMRPVARSKAQADEQSQSTNKNPEDPANLSSKKHLQA